MQSVVINIGNEHQTARIVFAKNYIDKVFIYVHTPETTPLFLKRRGEGRPHGHARFPIYETFSMTVLVDMDGLRMLSTNDMNQWLIMRDVNISQKRVINTWIENP